MESPLIIEGVVWLRRGEDVGRRTSSSELYDDRDLGKTESMSIRGSWLGSWQCFSPSRTFKTTNRLFPHMSLMNKSNQSVPCCGLWLSGPAGVVENIMLLWIALFLKRQTREVRRLLRMLLTKLNACRPVFNNDRSTTKCRLCLDARVINCYTHTGVVSSKRD